MCEIFVNFDSCHRMKIALCDLYLKVTILIVFISKMARAIAKKYGKHFLDGDICHRMMKLQQKCTVT